MRGIEQRGNATETVGSARILTVRGAKAAGESMGAQINQLFARHPLRGVIDPFISAGARAYCAQSPVTIDGNQTLESSADRFALVSGWGIHIPLPNRFELRGDVKDLMFFNVHNGTNGSSRTSNSLLIQTGLGITF